MGQTKIEWTSPQRADGTFIPGYTANLWIGCTNVSPGCDNCYAEALNRRWGGNNWGNEQPRRIVNSVWDDIKRYQKQAAAAEEVRMVFVGSLMDIAEKSMPVVSTKGEPMMLDTGASQSPMMTSFLRDKFFNEVVPASPNLLFLLLTKRPGNFNTYMPASWKINPPANVMFGTSIVQRDQLNTLLKQLKRVKGRRFLSLEPQLENIPNIDLTGIDWVIQGGESGSRKRPFDTDWARSMKYQCQVQQVPYFFKQIDKIQPIPDDLLIRQFPA